MDPSTWIAIIIGVLFFWLMVWVMAYSLYRMVVPTTKQFHASTQWMADDLAHGAADMEVRRRADPEYAAQLGAEHPAISEELDRYWGGKELPAWAYTLRDMSDHPDRFTQAERDDVQRAREGLLNIPACCFAQPKGSE